MNRPWKIWLAFGIALAIVVAAMGWLSHKALELDRQTLLEENARLALWRMDSAMALLVARESSRPYFNYEAFFSTSEPDAAAPALGAGGGMPGTPARPKTSEGRLSGGELLGNNLPSPLLTQSLPQIRMHFQVDPWGNYSSPGVPADADRDLARQYVSPVQAENNRKQLDWFRLNIDPEVLKSRLGRLDEPPSPRSAVSFNPSPLEQAETEESVLPSQPAQQPPAQGMQADRAQQQQTRGVNEFRTRSQYFTQSSTLLPNFNDEFGALLTRQDVRAGVMMPLWLGGELILARQVKIGSHEYIQGCILDWPSLRQELLGSIRDLLPLADLQPVESPRASDPARMLVSLPVRLVPGPTPALSGLSPIGLSLALTWASLSLAALAVAVLLQGVVSLSERRAAFVSAVTHELRTPLTTFRMYAEMLAEGMVPDEEGRQRYLGTLRIEADRLTHLVENVLAYARLERGRPGGRVAPIRVAPLLDHARQRLTERAGQAGFKLSMEINEPLGEMLVLADPSAVEQILFNLVDNACKYAVGTADRTLHLEAACQGAWLRLRLRDHGPGISDRQRRLLFQPFRKSARDAAHSAPGVGLGLALSRRMARDMGGDLRHEQLPETGACFALTLRAAAEERAGQ
jgi:signal transduction histidine kinase